LSALTKLFGHVWSSIASAIVDAFVLLATFAVVQSSFATGTGSDPLIPGSAEAAQRRQWVRDVVAATGTSGGSVVGAARSAVPSSPTDASKNADADVTPKAPVDDSKTESAPAAASQAPVVSQVQSLDRLQAEQERMRALIESQPKAYVDKVMDATPLSNATDAGTETLDLSNAGLRTYFVETRVGFADSATFDGGSVRAAEYGMRSEYRLETLNYGEFVGQVDVRARSGDPSVNVGSISAAQDKVSARVTLRDLGFPLTNSMFADAALGDITSDVTDALARSYRLSLGSNGVRGASVQVFGSGMDLRVGAGQRGNLTGTPYPAWERGDGMLAWAGYTHRFDRQLFAGVQISTAKDVPPAFGQTALLKSVNSVAASAGRTYEDATSGDYKARLTVLASNANANESAAPNTELKSSAVGTYLEAGYVKNGYRNEFGAYWSQPNLYFGDALLASDTRGAYWRVDRAGTRLQWGMGLDYEQQNTSRVAGQTAADVASLSANATYRLDRNSSVGGNVNFSDTKNKDVTPTSSSGGSRIYSLSGFYQTQFDWGRSRFTASARRNQTIVANAVSATGETIEWEHDWITAKYETQKPELVTTLGVARDHSASAQNETSPTAAVNFRYWPDAGWSVGGNLRYTSRTSNLSVSRGLSGTLNSELVMNAGWRVGLAASINEANIQVNNQGSFGTGIGTASLVTRTNDKSAYLYVRYEGSRGSPYQTLGLKSSGSAGAGDIRGIVYFDGNRDGVQQSDERGVPGVEVTLDGRYRTTTNAEGRFEFPVVAAGNHKLTLKLETVPLPWGAALESGLILEVPLRGTADARIPVVRVSE
jgi:hypothetical protein